MGVPTLRTIMLTILFLFLLFILVVDVDVSIVAVVVGFVALDGTVFLLNIYLYIYMRIFYMYV
jgi:hypothetical protein